MIRFLSNPECDFQLEELVFARCKNCKPWPAQIINIVKGRPFGSSVEEYIYKVKFIGHPSISDLCSSELEEFSEHSVKRYRKLYQGTKNPQQLNILKSIVKALNKKHEMQLMLKIPTVNIQYIETKKQQARKDKKLKQRPIKIEARQEKTVQNKQIAQVQNQQVAIQKVKAKVENQKIMTFTEKNEVKNKHRLIKIEQNPPNTQKYKLHLTNQVEAKLQEKTDKSIKKQKTKKKKASVQRSIEKYGMKSLIDSTSSKKSSNLAVRGDLTCRLPYKSYRLMKNQKCEQAEILDNEQIAKTQMEPNGLQIFQRQVRNILNNRKNQDLVTAKDQELKTTTQFDFSLLFKVQVSYNRALERRHISPEQHRTNIAVKEQDQNYYNYQEEVRKIFQTKRRQKKLRQQKIQIKLPQTVSPVLQTPRNIEIKYYDYLSFIKSISQQRQFNGHHRVEVWTNYAIKFFETLNRELRNINKKLIRLPKKRKQTLIGIFQRQQLTLQILLRNGILQMIVQFIQYYQVSQDPNKKQFQIQYQFFTAKMRVYKRILHKYATKWNIDKQKKVWLQQLLKQQPDSKNK